MKHQMLSLGKSLKEVTCGRFEVEYHEVAEQVYQQRHSGKFYEIVQAANMMVMLEEVSYKGPIKYRRKNMTPPANPGRILLDS